MNQELQTAVRAARTAGAGILKTFGELAHSDIQPKEYKDFVTAADRQSEADITKILTEAFPDDSLLCEEGSNKTGTSGRQWIVDPLDGTLNFIHSFPVFAVSIALRDSTGELALGVVYQPVLGELFTATRGEGAFLNGIQIHVSTRNDPEHFLIATGIPFKDYDYLDAYLATLRDVIHDSAGIRRAGSAALDLAYTACGRFDAFWEYKLYPWDYAAGVLLVREAGGSVTGFDGNSDVFAHHSIIAGTPATHGLISEKAQRHFIL